MNSIFDSYQQRGRQIEENGLRSFVLAERANDERTATLEKTRSVVNDFENVVDHCGRLVFGVRIINKNFDYMIDEIGVIIAKFGE